MGRTDKKKTFGQQSSKVMQLADTLSWAISMKRFREGGSLPSINQLSAEYGISRDTVFKAFLDLRERGLIDSTSGKGYYVTSQVTGVLLLLDQYTSFKEALYNSFVKHLPINCKVDLLFHQYNERLFNTIIRESVGKYNEHIVMNFDNEKFSMVLNKIHPTKLLLFDFGKFKKEKYFYIYQDFDEAFYQALLTLKKRLRYYPQLILLFSKNLKHPQSNKEYFTHFCEEQGSLCEIQEDTENLTVCKEVVYIAIKQQDVVEVAKQRRLEGLKCGKDFSLLAYNDIPSYRVVDEGITSSSIDWEMMGNEAASSVLNNVSTRKYLPTEVRLRKSPRFFLSYLQHSLAQILTTK